MAEKEQFQDVVNSLLNGMDGVLSAKTVVGAPIVAGDTTIIPLVDVTFGVAAGAGSNDHKSSKSGAGAMGGKMSPNAVLVIHDGNTRLVNVKNQDTLTKILDMVPEIISKITKPKKGELSDAEAEEIAFPEDNDDSFAEEE